LKLLDAGPRSADSSTAIVLCGPDDEPLADSSAATALAQPVQSGATRAASTPLRFSKRLAVAVGSLLGAGLLVLVAATVGPRFWKGPSPQAAISKNGEDREPVASKPSVRLETAVAGPDTVELNIAYGTEKQQWLEAATAEFQKSAAGRGITINLFGMGSMEGARAVLEGPQPVPIHVWSPASSAYRDHFEREWRAKHDNKQPIIKSEALALTPMVFVMWEKRREHFLKKYAKVSFQTIAEAVTEQGGWGTIAGQRDWGRFKFGHTHPGQSNSGLLTLVLLAYEFSHKEHSLTRADVAEPKFRAWLEQFERGVARPGGSLNHSTGTMMRETILRGPSHFDCLLIYENLAIAYLGAARDRWGELHVDYPEPNIWNDHPFYILDVPWSDARNRAVAAEFLKFLMSEPIQKRALEHGFRPGNPDISVRFPESPLIRNSSHGVRIDLPRMCEPPKDEVIQDLLALSRRIDS
jgi:Ca-activated chloride channel family protein